MSRKYPYDTKGVNMRAHHYRSAHGWRDAYDGSHEGTQRLIDASRSRYGLHPISEASQIDQNPRDSIAPPLGGGVALVALAGFAMFAVGATAGYFFGKKKAEKS